MTVTEVIRKSGKDHAKLVQVGKIEMKGIDGEPFRD